MIDNFVFCKYTVSPKNNISPIFAGFHIDLTHKPAFHSTFVECIFPVCIWYHTPITHCIFLQSSAFADDHHTLNYLLFSTAYCFMQSPVFLSPESAMDCIFLVAVSSSESIANKRWPGNESGTAKCRGPNVNTPLFLTLKMTFRRTVIVLSANIGTESISCTGTCP